MRVRGREKKKKKRGGVRSANGGRLASGFKLLSATEGGLIPRGGKLDR